MGIASSLTALSNFIDPTLSHWEAVLTTGKRWNEHHMLPTLRKGVAGWRQLDWSLDIVSTGDINRIKELWLMCPDGRKVVLDIHSPGRCFQFKTKTMHAMSGGGKLEYQVIGRLVGQDGSCECLIWDYNPAPLQSQLLSYTSNIQKFGAWRETMMPIGALNLEVQGLRL